jgi:hypothetical protein
MKRSPASQIQIAVNPNGRKEDFRGLDKETVPEFVARGGHINHIPFIYRPEETMRAFPRHESKHWSMEVMP